MFRNLISIFKEFRKLSNSKLSRPDTPSRLTRKTFLSDKMKHKAEREYVVVFWSLKSIVFGTPCIFVFDFFYLCVVSSGIVLIYNCIIVTWTMLLGIMWQYRNDIKQRIVLRSRKQPRAHIQLRNTCIRLRKTTQTLSTTLFVPICHRDVTKVTGKGKCKTCQV